jgi:hypothetical protein
MSWPKVKELAHNDACEVERTLGSRLRADELGAKCSIEEIIRCLRAVAARLGVKVLDPAAHDHEREKVLAENQRRWRHGREIVFPTANQIIWIVG